MSLHAKPLCIDFYILVSNNIEVKSYLSLR